MVIVDSTVWVDYLADREIPETVWLDREMELQRIGLTDLILCEVPQGVRGDVLFRETKRKLMEFEVFDPGGAELAVAAAENYRKMRARGLAVRKTIDCLIATFCIEGRHTLPHHDRDFDPFEIHLGLMVIHP